MVPDYWEVFFAENNFKLHVAVYHDHFMNNCIYDKSNFSSLSPNSPFLTPSELNFKQDSGNMATGRDVLLHVFDYLTPFEEQLWFDEAHAISSIEWNLSTYLRIHRYPPIVDFG